MIFISATDTNIGKTHFSGLLIKELLKHYKADEIAYYKPIQCGREFDDTKKEYQTDLETISDLDLGIDAHNSYFLNYPAAPLLSAKLENTDISIAKIRYDFAALKAKYKFIIVEGAGGLAVPIKNGFMISDLAKALDLPLLLIARPDLGTINHTILSIEHAQKKDIPILGFMTSEVFSETRNFEAVNLEELSAKDIEDNQMHIKTAPNIISDFTDTKYIESFDNLISLIYTNSYEHELLST